MLSRRLKLKSERMSNMDFKVGKVREGARITGTVYKVTPNEVTLDINYTTEGTIYLNEMTQKNVGSCHDLVKEGDSLEVIVKKVDDEKGIVLLSRLDLEAQEGFETLQQYFTDETIFEVKVQKATKGGLVVSALGYGRMFMPISEISTDFIENPDTFVNKDLQVKVIEIKREKVIVSHKIVEREAKKVARQEALESIQVGDVYDGKVAKIMPYGAFVRIGEVEALLHISEISHHNVKEVKDVLEEGQAVKVKVIGAKNNKRSLSMKALQKTPWEDFVEAHKVGEEITGKIVKKMQFGMLVEVEKDVVGMLNRYDYSWDPRQNYAGEVEIGDEVNVKITSIDEKAKRMTLSKKHLEYNPWEDVNFKIGEKVSGQVKVLQSNGALVEVQGVNAFLPIGEVSSKRIGHVNEVLSEDDVINATVLKFDKKNWQLVISKQKHDEVQERDEYKKYLRSENKEEQSQTLGELFAEKLKGFKK
ncbi:MAG: 30S ribosomal protein S1 [Acholeplasmatales bacterium]|nr:MAG: 30S ribosomal protein S1 [Acholeplasmatales bacterium]